MFATHRWPDILRNDFCRLFPHGPHPNAATPFRQGYTIAMIDSEGSFITVSTPRRPMADGLLGAAILACFAVSQWLGDGCGDNVQMAYIGPGAGLALVGSFLAVLTAILSAVGVLLTWPIRWVWHAVRGRKANRRAKVGRVVILGLDGLDPDLAEQFMQEGLLPNLAKLRERGSYTRLGTTWRRSRRLPGRPSARGPTPESTISSIFFVETRRTIGRRRLPCGLGLGVNS